MISKHTLALTLGAVAGCASKDPAPAAPAGPVTTAPTVAAEVDDEKIEADLAKLRALTMVEVGQLILDAPEGAFSCYGPCPQFTGQIAAAKAKSAGRLERLLAAATAASPDPLPTSCEQASVDRNLAALRDLKIVDVGGLIVEAPATSPQCYNQPCPPDVAAAKAKMCERAAKLAGIVAAAKDI